MNDIRSPNQIATLDLEVGRQFKEKLLTSGLLQ